MNFCEICGATSVCRFENGCSCWYGVPCARGLAQVKRFPRCASTYPGAVTLNGKPIRCEGKRLHEGQHFHTFAARYWGTPEDKGDPMKPRYTAGDVRPFRCTAHDDLELRAHDRQDATILRRLTRREADLDETGPMYRLRFSDGYERDAFEDELDGTDPFEPAK
jgi:hypothetical protein